MTNNDMDTKQPAPPTVDVGAERQAARLRKMSWIDEGVEERFSTGIGGLDACLAPADDQPGGFVRGSSILFSGAPGGGKSTIALIAAAVHGDDALYLHGEENAARVKRRWHGLGLEGDPMLSELDDAWEAIEDIQVVAPRLAVVDSFNRISLDGRRGNNQQAEGIAQIARACAQVGTTLLVVAHVDKSGRVHKGSNEVAHDLDVHIHVTLDSKKGERTLEVRKNRHGRAGFAVELKLDGKTAIVGAPTPIGDMVQARSALERAAEKASQLLLQGRTLTGYDFDEAGVSGNVWRAGLEVAAKRLARDGHNVEEVKVNGRRGYRVVMVEGFDDEEEIY